MLPKSDRKIILHSSFRNKTFCTTSLIPIESDSVADATESSALKRDSPSVFAPIAWSAISEIRK